MQLQRFQAAGCTWQRGLSGCQPTLLRVRGRARALQNAERAANTSPPPSAPKSSPLLTADEEDFTEDDNAECAAFEDRDGQLVEVMCCDYGWRTGAQRMGTQNDGNIPTSGLQLALNNFREEFRALRRSFREDEYATMAGQNPPRGWTSKVANALGKAVVGSMAAADRALESAGVLSKLERRPPPPNATVTRSRRGECAELRAKLKQLKLSNAAVWEREHKRESSGGAIKTPWFVKGVYLSLCMLLDVLFNNRPIQRFWFLECVARMPYFSYIACLHLYESLGWWRAGAELRRVHFAEEYNELHHLQIMESLGGDRLWADRFVAYHSAIVYFWVLVVLFIVNPALAYNFSELIEAHAVDTYGEFADVNKELLKSLPPPLIALQYYRSNDLYMFDEFQTSHVTVPRTPPTKNLYDVFINIRDDEHEHVLTMHACVDNSVVLAINQRKEVPRRL